MADGGGRSAGQYSVNAAGSARLHLGNNNYDQRNAIHHTENYWNRPSSDPERHNMALLEAATRGYTYRLKAQLRAGADIDYVDHSGSTALYLAACAGFDDCVQILLEAGSDINAQDCVGQTALYVAAREGHIDVVRTLLSFRGVDINNMGLSRPIKVAIERGHLEIVIELVERGVDLSAAAGSDISRELFHEDADAFTMAVRSRQYEILRWLLQTELSAQEDLNNALTFAVGGSGDEEPEYKYADLLIDCGASKDYALYRSVWSQRLAAVYWLLDEGADLNAELDFHRGTAFQIATKYWTTVDFSEAFITRCPDLDVQDFRGWTALHYAVADNDLDKVSRLVKAKASLDVTNSDGQTPLQMARTRLSDVGPSLIEIYSAQSIILCLEHHAHNVNGGR